MNYHEVHRDLFGINRNFTLVHCISADFALGAGIAKAFSGMGVKTELLKNYPIGKWDNKGYCLYTNAGKSSYSGVMNLVTKRFCYQKPTYDTLRQALYSMKEECRKREIHTIAMPKIGCGLDKLEWNQVSEIIQNIFSDTDMEILVCVR